VVQRWSRQVEQIAGDGGQTDWRSQGRPGNSSCPSVPTVISKILDEEQMSLG
jgi:hypothetical protein